MLQKNRFKFGYSANSFFYTTVVVYKRQAGKENRSPPVGIIRGQKGDTMATSKSRATRETFKHIISKCLRTYAMPLHPYYYKGCYWFTRGTYACGFRLYFAPEEAYSAAAAEVETRTNSGCEKNGLLEKAFGLACISYPDGTIERY